MVADGADVGSGSADHDVAAVAAFPYLDFALGEDSGGLDILEQCAVALLVVLLDGSDQAEFLGQLGETFCVGGLCEFGVHVGPFVVLASGGGGQVLGGGANAVQLLEPMLGVLFLVLGGLEEEGGNLLEALLLRYRSEIGVFVACLRLAGKCGLQVFLGLCAFVLVVHGVCI